MNVRPCFECNAPSDAEHHVVPQSKGGTRAVPLCGTCHGKIHGEHLTNTRHLTQAALDAKKARGERTGNVPFGYHLAPDGVHLEIDDDEQLTIARARRWRCARYSLREIVAVLNAEGRRGRTGKPLGLRQVALLLASKSSEECETLLWGEPL